ncbi:MAG: carboxypeptidase regulatory-like domain-containing protein, partial [Anaerolineales bacterium]|nr:carboxypeptidase regulatory-like domain-containing protein [Anaerolineales bacterium]
DVLWLGEDPITGTIPAWSTQQITVSFDASGSEIAQPGEYSARLRIVHDTPYLVADIPVVMAVQAPDAWGKLQGAVSGLGYCDADPAALEQAEVVVSSTGVSWTVTTDADGIYQLWLDQVHSPLSIAVTFAGHQPATAAGVTVTGGTTTTADLSLRWSQSCLAVEPSGLSATLDYGEMATLPVTISNSGATGLTFELEEIDGGYTPAAGTVEVLLLTPDSDASKLSALLAGFSDLHVTWWDAAAGAPTAGDLASYDVVIFGNNTTWSSSGMDPIDVGDALADYIDGGGKAIDTLYTHSFDRWALDGRYLSEDYGPFATAANDYDTFPSMGTVYSPDHPIMDGVGTIVLDWLPSQYSHQDPGLAPGATRMADWEDNKIFIAYNDHVVGLNLQAFSQAAWSDACDMPELVHNSIRYLTGGAPTDVPWLSEEP